MHNTYLAIHDHTHVRTHNSYYALLPERKPMKYLIISLLLCIAPTKLFSYRDGARENSCYDHSIQHGEGTETFNCVPASCPFFLRIKEVVNEDTLELSNETVSTYECGRIYGSKRVPTLS